MTQTDMDQFLNLKKGHSKNWKFGLITYDILKSMRTKEAWYISDTSSGWVETYVDRETLIAVLSGEKALETLNWK